ncbi:lipopolysaccharide biosynthesis protein [Nodularia spumigena]|uniref:lipopolysaccharide biosynthesis protein n=1 Tax=Nodularia spumigena TaxID=70799 RepID=UPI002B209B7D|nr:oligosaccharide flippase family protein [Nodularia spumigena]MEA5558045.1 oligosaccharide flippase family protein [Nodularia spumigena CH309]
MRRAARATALISIGQAAVKTTQLVLAVLLVRLMSPEEWNEAAFLLSIYLAGTTIGTLNIHHGIVFFLPRVDQRKRRNLVLQNVGLVLGIGLLVTLALIVARPLLSGGQLGDGSALPWLGLAITLELPSSCVGMTMIGLERYGSVAMWDLAGTGALLAGAIVPVAAGYGIDGLVVGLLLAGTVRFVAGLWYLFAAVPGSAGGLGRSLLLDQLRYGIPLGATIAVAVLNRSIDKWLIAAFEPADFGIYAVAAQEVPLLAVLPYAGGAALVTSLVAAFHDADRAAAHADWLQLTGAMTLLVVPLGVGLILVAPELLPAIFGEEFARGVLPFQVFTAITLHRVAEYGMMLRAAGRTRELLQVAGVTLGANIVLAGLGAWLGGMTGSACGALLASALGWTVALRHIGRSLGVPVRHAFPWPRWSAAVATCSTAAMIAWALSRVLDVGGMASAGLQLLVFVVLVAPALGVVAAATPTALEPPHRPPATLRSVI